MDTSPPLQQYITGALPSRSSFPTNLIWLLQHVDNSQHAFSPSSRLTLHNALPALERLYAEWEKASNKAHYEKFKPALMASMAKLDKYYQCSGASDAHLIAMGKTTVMASSILTNTAVVLNPTLKMSHFKKQWSLDLVWTLSQKSGPCLKSRGCCLCMCMYSFYLELILDH